MTIHALRECAFCGLAVLPYAEVDFCQEMLEVGYGPLLAQLRRVRWAVERVSWCPTCRAWIAVLPP